MLLYHLIEFGKGAKPEDSRPTEKARPVVRIRVRRRSARVEVEQAVGLVRTPIATAVQHDKRA